jgi:hypothetical protein
VLIDLCFLFSFVVSMLIIVFGFLVALVSFVFSTAISPNVYKTPLSFSQFSSFDSRKEVRDLREKELFSFSPPDFASLKLRKAYSSRRNGDNEKEEEIAPIGWLYERFYEDEKCKKRALAQTGTRAGVCITNPQATGTNATGTSYMIVCSES